LKDFGPLQIFLAGLLLYQKKISNDKSGLKKLIMNIYVAPTCDKWFKDLVQSILIKYGINIEVIQSSLDDDPVY